MVTVNREKSKESKKSNRSKKSKKSYGSNESDKSIMKRPNDSFDLFHRFD